MSSLHCPVCGSAMHTTHFLEVCAGCHNSLHIAASTAVSSTGEFALSDVMALAERAQMAPTPESETAVSCSWCGQTEGRVRKLLSQNGVHICNACVGLCVDIMSAELGENWRE